MPGGIGRPRLRIRTLLVLVACAAVVLAAWSELRDPVRRWKRAIRSDEDSARRWEAVSKAISGNVPGVDAGMTLQELAAALGDPGQRVRETACHGLGRLGAAAESSIPALARVVVDDRAHTVRAAAATALAEILEQPNTDKGKDIAVPALVRALKDRTFLVRFEAAFTLARIGECEPTVPVLIESLRQHSTITTSRSCWALKKLGRKAAPAVPALLELAGNFEPWAGAQERDFCRSHAIGLLLHLGQKNALRETLERAGKSPDASVRDEAVGLIESYGLDEDE